MEWARGSRAGRCSDEDHNVLRLKSRELPPALEYLSIVNGWVED